MLDWPALFTLAAGGDHGGAQDVLVLVVAAAVVAVASRRLHFPTIPGYLIVGALVGVHGLEFVQSDESIVEIRNLAIILLMFTIGMHMDLDHMRSGMVRMLMAGLISTLGVIFIGWPLAMALGAPAPAALAISMALAMSSTAVGLGILQQRRETNLVHGRLAIGIELVQDLISVAVLGLMPALAAWAAASATGAGAELAGEVAAAGGDGEDGLPTLLSNLSSGLLAIGGVGVMLAMGRYLLPGLLREASRTAGGQSGGSGAEAVLVVSTAVALAAAGATLYLGFGEVLGAFLAGFMLASTPFRFQLAGQLAPLRELFMAVFFTAVGMNMDLSIIVSNWWIVLIGLLLLFVVKTLVVAVTTWACGATASVAATTAFLVGQAGEFSLVVLGAAKERGVVDNTVGGVAIAIVVLSLVVATPWYDLAPRLTPRLRRVPTARWFRDRAGAHAHAAEPGHEHTPAHDLHTEADHGHAATTEHAGHHAHADSRHVIIAGFGVVGRNLAEHFSAAGIPYSVIELNTSTVRKQRSLGRKTVYGDVANPDVLREAGIDTAEAVVLTIPDDEATLRACQAVRAIAPTVFIAARTSYLSKAIAATELGADHVTIEEVVTAQDMAKQVMNRIKGRFSPSTT